MIELIAICLVLITIAMLFGSDTAAGLVKGIFKLAIVGIVIIIFLVIIYS